MIYTVTFNPAIDYVVHLNGSFKLGGINRNAFEDFQFGGKGINVSNVLRTLGIDTAALGFVAGFIGDGLENGLRGMGLKTDFIHVKEGMTRVNVKIKADEETELNGIGPVITDSDMDKLIEKLDKITADDVLVFSGSIPKCLPGDTYEKLMARLDGRGIPIAVDAEKDLLVNVLKYHPFLIKPNNHELGAIFGKVLKTDEEIAECAKKLQEMGARNVLISMAGDGAMLLDEKGGVHRIGCPKGKVQNSVGAGDSMVAGFLAGYMQTGDYEYALKLGTATGSATAFSIGLASKPLIDELLAAL
jgi:1-phosphofructokinase